MLIGRRVTVALGWASSRFAGQSSYPGSFHGPVDSPDSRLALLDGQDKPDAFRFSRLEAEG